MSGRELAIRLLIFVAILGALWLIVPPLYVASCSAHGACP